MIGKKTISGKAAYLLPRLFAVVAVLIFVLSFTTPAMARENTMTGVVTSVDTYANALVVKSTGSQPLAMTAGEYTFRLNNRTNVVLCDQNRSIEDIGAGQKVTVTYHEQNGRSVADRIDISTPSAPVIVACNLE